LNSRNGAIETSLGRVRDEPRLVDEGRRRRLRATDSNVTRMQRKSTLRRTELNDEWDEATTDAAFGAEIRRTTAYAVVYGAEERTAPTPSGALTCRADAARFQATEPGDWLTSEGK